MIITIANNKGGCAKTTSAINIAASLTNRGYNVLLVDCDGQANATTSLGIDASGNTMYDALSVKAAAKMSPYKVYASDKGKLDMLPSCRELAGLESVIASAEDGIWRLDKYLKHYPEYDAIIIDTPPAQGGLLYSAIACCDYLIIPVAPYPLHLSGMGALIEIIDRIGKIRYREIPYKVLVTMFDSRLNLQSAAVNSIDRNNIPMYGTKIRNNVALAEAPSFGMDVYRYRPKCNGAQDYSAVVDELIKDCKL